ncbi:MAG: tetratricopeptide repeat protein [Bryobacterales bacterium]|nr:tetratricopeptide repeat protein [Bryobacterales bacterium]
MKLLFAVAFVAGYLPALQPNVLEQAEAAFRAGDVNRASTLARQALQQDANAPAAHMILGVIAAQQQKWVAAGRHFQTVIRVIPQDPNGYFYLGQAKLYQKQWAEAATLFTKALERKYPERERLLVELAFAENEANQSDKALQHLAEAGTPDASVAAQYYAVSAFANARVRRYRQALEAINKALEREPANPQHWDFLITTLIGTDQMTAALREAIRAQAKFPDNGDIQYLFALASYYVAESPLNPLALRNLREVEPDSPRVLLAEGLLYRKQGKTDEATARFLKAAARGVEDSHLLLAIVYRENGDAAAAEREYRLAEKSNPHNGQVLLELGKVALTRGVVVEAVSRLERAVEMMPDNSSAHYQLGLAYARAGKKAESAAQLNAARELDKKQSELQK